MLLNKQLRDDIRRQGMVVFAGAGVSMSAPSALPSWHSLNHLIFNCLCDSHEAFLDKPGYLAAIRDLLSNEHQSGNLPPDYQAQLLHEYIGDSYFRLLQCIDTDVINANHRALASLAAEGFVKAIVTTNTDQLIEIALAEFGVAFNVSFDESTYEQCFERLLQDDDSTSVTVIKIHGCVRDRQSLVDTLKRRLLGRNVFLERCLARLLSHYYLVCTGFSGRDLESDPSYLGLLESAVDSPGLLFNLWPGTPVPSHGASAMISAYGQKAQLYIAETAALLDSINNKIHHGSFSVESLPADSGYEAAERAIAMNCHRLSASLVATSLAAMLQVNGETRSAYRILHTFWRQSADVGLVPSGSVCFRLLHGRQGLGLGLIGEGSKLHSGQLQEGVKSLLSVKDHDNRAKAWAGLSLTWWGEVDRGYKLMLSSFLNTQTRPQSVDEQLDCWFAFAEYRFFTAEGLDVFENWPKYLAMAKTSGDLARLARLSAMVYLHLSDRVNNVANAEQMYRQMFLPQIYSRSRRLNDPVSEGLVALARASWYNRQNNADWAMAAIETAMQKFSRAGMVRWYDYAKIELSKAMIDQSRLDDASRLLTGLEDSLAERALLQPQFHATWAVLHLTADDLESSAKAYSEAAVACGQLGMRSYQLEYERASEEVRSARDSTGPEITHAPSDD